MSARYLSRTFSAAERPVEMGHKAADMRMGGAWLEQATSTV
jgi:hypothetical protein